MFDPGPTSSRLQSTVNAVLLTVLLLPNTLPLPVALLQAAQTSEAASVPLPLAARTSEVSETSEVLPEDVSADWWAERQDSVRQSEYPASLADQPAALQAAYAEALGNADSAYHVIADGQGGWQADTPGHSLSSAFTSEGVVVRAGDDSLQMTLRQVGYGEQLTAVQSAVPQVDGNRVLYRRGDLTEWYVNGPLGLEQGFTLDSPPTPLNPPHGGGK